MYGKKNVSYFEYVRTIDTSICDKQERFEKKKNISKETDDVFFVMRHVTLNISLKFPSYVITLAFLFFQNKYILANHFQKQLLTISIIDIVVTYVSTLLMNNHCFNVIKINNL
jgi:hypothetical protein